MMHGNTKLKFTIDVITYSLYISIIMLPFADKRGTFIWLGLYKGTRPDKRQ